MATTTFAECRQNLMKLLNQYRPLTATSQGGGSGASYISTDAKKWDGGNNDFFNQQWIVTTSGATQEERFITDYVTSSGTFTPTPNFSAQIANSVTAEVLPYEPATVLDAFQRAIDIAYPSPLAGRKGLFRTIFEEFVANSYLWNSHFEDWNASTIPDHWVKSGSATVSEETAIIRGPLGTSAVKITGGGSSDYIYQSHVENPPLLEFESHSVTFYVWAWCASASKARITIAYKVASDGSLTTTSSSYHTGNSEYELLSKVVTFPADVTDVQVRLESGGSTVYYDNLYNANGPQLFRYHISKDFFHMPVTVERQRDEWNSDGADMVGGESWEQIPTGMWDIEDNGTNRILVINNIRTSHYWGIPFAWNDRTKLRVTGNERLSSPTTDSSTIEVVGDQMRALVALATGELMFSIAMTASALGSSLTDYSQKASAWRGEGERLLQLHGLPMPTANSNIRIR
jgi:hypothetical protein|tara:strand:- start:6076 stop:7452 length:1377 start_codon:yes stop_codon:yes gene_type:complete